VEIDKAQMRGLCTRRINAKLMHTKFMLVMWICAPHRFWESVARHIKEFASAAFDTWKPQALFEDWRD
jgi:hypothetical protein